MYRKFNFCSRIVRIFGISLDINANEFLLIMQHANGGNLRQYLKDHFSKLTWDDKMKLAYQITEGIKFLHDADIIHQNLHPKNIVIHKKEAKIMLDIVKIKVIDKSELSDMKNIDGGHFGIISKAKWKKTNNYVICKRLKNNESISNKPTEAFIYELKMHGRLNFCQRIIRILGISLDEETKEHLLITEYADGGNLRMYLKDHPELTWDDRIKLTYQITEGIKFLQGEKILHRDLHSGNIVVHQGEAKIIDLGIAKSMETQTNIHSGVFGVIAEEPVPDTPDKYLKLYKSCWEPEPNKRPSISQVFSKLVKLGREMSIQDFQDIKCDDDDMQSIQDNDNNTDAQAANINGEADDNYDLDVPDGTI
ncbi:unnamed protein product [Rhizophagus irregularis]|nr:unnamed protein product [Rhizophagus irregularis]